MKTVSVIVPTMWRFNPFIEYMNSLLDCEHVGELIIIDNDPTRTPELPNHPKLKYYTFGTNIFVNPAWNFGVSAAQSDFICLLNDDLQFDHNVIPSVITELEKPYTGVIGITPGVEQFNQIPVTDGDFNIIPWQPGMHQFGYGCLLFIHKQRWVNIPNELKIYYGDYFIFDSNLSQGRINYCITNMKHKTSYAQTCVEFYIEKPEYMHNLQTNEGLVYDKIKENMFKIETDIKQEIPQKPADKNILIAIPTGKYIEPATFKSIFDLKVPKGYKLHFQYFYGYQIDQIRNLIAEWGKSYDYLFCVDSDIILPSDALMKMIGWDKDIISGVYIQRIPGTHTIELYQENNNGGFENISWNDIKLRIGLLEVAACGFGCVLINSEVLRAIPYPHFVYKSALNHKDTHSEDIYFCEQARKHGFSVWCDTTILCEHIGSYSFKVEEQQPKAVIEYIHDEDRLPFEHQQYLQSIASLQPKVVYDIGACVLHWERHAKKAWPEAKFILFDAEPGVERILANSGHEYYVGLLTDKDNKQLDFYHWLENPGGNSCYKEINPGWEQHRTTKTGMTLDTIVQQNRIPLPDLIKLDVQGAEIDILKGATMCLQHCTDIILEAQHKVYNEGAPLVEDVFTFMNSIGYELVSTIQTVEYDGDYHFRKRL